MHAFVVSCITISTWCTCVVVVCSVGLHGVVITIGTGFPLTVARWNFTPNFVLLLLGTYDIGTYRIFNKNTIKLSKWRLDVRTQLE